MLEVPYTSGDVLPYGILLSTRRELSWGAFYVGASTWMGYEEPPFGDPVLVATVDANVDGLFNTGEAPDDFEGAVRDLRDITCIDFDRNGALNECEQTEDYTGERVNPVYPGPLLSHIFQHHSGICGFGAPGGEGGMNNSTSERRSNRLSWRTRSIRCRVQLSRRTNFR